MSDYIVDDLYPNWEAAEQAISTFLDAVETWFREVKSNVEALRYRDPDTGLSLKLTFLNPATRDDLTQGDFSDQESIIDMPFPYLLSNSADILGTDFADNLTGGSQGDTIHGEGRNDTIRGGDGNDYIDGGGGKKDILIGGNKASDGSLDDFDTFFLSGNRSDYSIVQSGKISLFKNEVTGEIDVVRGFEKVEFEGDIFGPERTRIQNFVLELAELSKMAYESTFQEGRLEGKWLPVHANELGIPVYADDSSYSMINGVFSAINGAGVAHIGEAMIDGQHTIFIAFRGTDDSVDAAFGWGPQVEDYYWPAFDPLLDGLRSFSEERGSNIIVTGHSLGGILAQMFMEEFKDENTRAVTFASPGSPTGEDADPRILHIEHSQDIVPWIGDIAASSLEELLPAEHENLAYLWKFHKAGERVIIPVDDGSSLLDNFLGPHEHNMSMYLENIKAIYQSKISVDVLDVDSYRPGFISRMYAAPSDVFEFYGDKGDYDEILIGNNEENDINGYGGDDKIFGRGKKDFINGRNGADEIFGGQGKDAIFGGKGNDTIFGGDGEDVVFGDKDNDEIFGKKNNDTLSGGGGSDRIDGGPGDDTLVGGKKGDIFIFSKGRDTVHDFNAYSRHEDIDLSGTTWIRNYKDITKNHLTQVGENAVLDDLEGNTLTLIGVSLADLDRSDFIL
ncbi:hypothetical protein AYJ57_20010 [Salipiger sp. CCB-MM3]|nr:hypothetical protein AYJ57_20010 [Salipiger sp. CCB-MM3]